MKPQAWTQLEHHMFGSWAVVLPGLFSVTRHNLLQPQLLHQHIQIPQFLISGGKKKYCLEDQVLTDSFDAQLCSYLLNNIMGEEELKELGLIFNTAINSLCNRNIPLYTSLFIYETSVKHLKNLRRETQCKCKALPRNNL